MKKKLILNLKFNRQGQVECSKSPSLCKECNSKGCERMTLYYYPYSKKDIEECFKNSDRRT